MSERLNSINGFTTGSIAFLFAIVFLLSVVGIADTLRNVFGSLVSSVWMFFVILFVLCVYYRELKRR